MKRVLVTVAGVAVLANAGTVNAVPVVPNFTQGSMTSVTTQTCLLYTSDAADE